MVKKRGIDKGAKRKMNVAGNLKTSEDLVPSYVMKALKYGGKVKKKPIVTLNKYKCGGLPHKK